MTELLYTGKSESTVTWWGPVTGTQYKAGKIQPRIFVDNRDADAALRNWKERDVTVFVHAPKVQPVAPVKLPPAPVAEPEIETEPDGDINEVVAEQPSDVDIDATGGAMALADEHGIDLCLLYSGERITKRDVERWIENYSGDSGDI